MAGDHGIHNLDLPCVVGLFIRPVPQHVDVEIARGFVHTGMDRDEEQVGCGLGHHTDQLLVRSPACGQERRNTAENEMPPRKHLNIIERRRSSHTKLPQMMISVQIPPALPFAIAHHAEHRMRVPLKIMRRTGETADEVG